MKAASSGGVWAQKALTILIHPPWWRTWWAYCGHGILCLGFLYGLRQYTIKRERLKHELNVQRMEFEKMHEIDHLKSRFYTNISHEFRTPLTLILGSLEKFIARSSDDNQDKPVYRMMQRNAQRLLELINQLLDLSKLEAGSMKLETEPADIVGFLKAIMLSFTFLAERRKIRYLFQFPNENQVGYFDADKLEKIMVNLLSNAFKFTPQGGEITVTARLIPDDNQSLLGNLKKTGSSSKVSILELKVQDNGKGMQKDQLDKIFDRFYQADNSQIREQDGTGIGLSLVKELIELHNGKITVESQPGEGSCFKVHLPLPLADFNELVIAGSEPDAHKRQLPFELEENATFLSLEADKEKEALEAPIVLVIEDNEDVRYFLKESLQPFYRIMEAVDGEEGFRRAVQVIPDLILSDIMMPKMNGVDMCRKLKENEKTAHIPVILVTAKASGEDRREGLEKGADDYLIKPFEAAELLARIKNLIASRKKLREHFSKQITLQPSSIAISSVDEQFLQRVMKIIEAHISDTLFGVEAFSREVGMSRMQLFRKLKALTNHSPGDFIRIMRLKRAAELLSRGAGSIAEVAFQVGFNEPSYFTKCFHKEFGQTPSEFLATGTFNQEKL